MFLRHFQVLALLLTAILALLIPIVAIVSHYRGKAHGERLWHETVHELIRAWQPIPPELLEDARDSDWHRAWRERANNPTVREAIDFWLKEFKPTVRRFTPHDLRSTMKSHMRALGIPWDISEMCLNHKLTGVEGTALADEVPAERATRRHSIAQQNSEPPPHSGRVPVLPGGVPAIGSRLQSLATENPGHQSQLAAVSN